MIAQFGYGQVTPEFYLEHIKPVLHERCYACHGALKQKADLRLDTGSLIRKGGETGSTTALDGGPVEYSILIERLIAKDDSRMPPEGKPLSEEEIAHFKQWVKAGAVSPEEEKPEPDPRDHWAFGKIQAPPVPVIPGVEGLNPIDAFLMKRQMDYQLKVLPRADRAVLLRRVYLDLIGLPPTLEQLEAFLDDDSADAYVKVVDQLLASKQYGERWGRHWMDVWRYSDWFGLGQQLRYSQKHIYHWRDWIVESLNADKSYAQMIREMLAADEMYPTDLKKLRATGFLARNYFLFNRTTWLDKTIEHTSKAFLGLTMDCAKCHDHKYDPISQKDYYRFRAFFEPHQIRLDALPGELDLEKNGLPRAFDAHPDAPTYLHIRGDAKNPDKANPIQPRFPRTLDFVEVPIKEVKLPGEGYHPAIREYVKEEMLKAGKLKIQTAEKQVAEAQKQLAGLKQQPQEQTEAITGQPFLEEHFDGSLKPNWTTSKLGKWKLEQGKLIQSEVMPKRSYVQTMKHHPQDFSATLSFTNTGGGHWKSIGIGFDVTEKQNKQVYLSAVNPGSKVQVMYEQNGKPVYPGNAKQDRPVPLNRPIVLTIKVRGQLVNVSVNGQHAVAYRLPVKREPGYLQITCFDTTAIYDNITIKSLPKSEKLVEANGKPGDFMVTTQAQGELQLKLRQLKLELAQHELAVIQSTYGADAGKARGVSDKQLKPLITAANEAENKKRLMRAELDVLQAELDIALAGNADDKLKKKQQQALKQLEQVEKKIAEGGYVYTRLRASRKALEGPDEKDDSRYQPYPSVSTGRRMALAKWMTHPDHPLTARVAVNHIWTRHFNQPLVDPLNDFGRRTPEPVLKDLLDYLARDLIEHDWSMKRLHRMIVTSAAYQRSTSTLHADEPTVARDSNNQYYWRRLPGRMESQVVRDSVLHLAGELDLAYNGPPVDPAKQPDAKYRSMYFKHSRDQRHQFLTMFDDADIIRCYRREQSVVPQQALALSNSKLALGASKMIAEKLLAQYPDATPEFLMTRAYRLILTSAPTGEELEKLVEGYRQLEAVLKPKHDQYRERVLTNIVHVLLNHNDFITIR